MASRPLYRKYWRAVTLTALALLLAQIAPTQTTARPKADKGPRAVGLLELAPNGGARLVPVVIMVDGQFYDASAYKAAPVPMALDYGNVYEAERAGVSLGLFTVTGALEAKNKDQSPPWVGEGKWLPAGSIPPKTTQKAEDRPRGMGDDPDKPPVLLRRAPASPKSSPPAAQPAAPATPVASSAPAPATPTATPSGSTAPVASGSTPPAPATASSGPATQPPTSVPSSSPVASAQPPAPTPSPAPSSNDLGPALRRGKWSPMPKDEPNHPAKAGKSSPGTAAAAGSTAAASSPNSPAAKPASDVQIVPAISDAGGPEPRPYNFAMKPAELEQFQTKMLAMAADEIRSRARVLSANTVGAQTPVAAHAPARKTAASKPVPPAFADVQLHVYDLTSNNEPVVVLTASAHLPPGRDGGPPGLQYLLTLVAREDIYGDLHKAFSSVTDTQHLDVQPRYDLIDAVDADGDGRGELLFRKVFDGGSAYALYRVIGNQLWPLFEGTP